MQPPRTFDELLLHTYTYDEADPRFNDLAAGAPLGRKPRIDAHVALINRLVPIDRSTRFLEVGAGDGAYTMRLARLCGVTAVDTYDRARFGLAMDPTWLRFPDGSFDVVFCHDTLEHSPDPQAVVRELARVTSGHLVLLAPNGRHPWNSLRAIFRGERFSPRLLRDYIYWADVEVEHLFGYGRVLWGFGRQALGRDLFLIAQKVEPKGF